MRHQLRLRPSVDGLENKTLLSGMAAGIVPYAPVHLPPAPIHLQPVAPGHLHPQHPIPVSGLHHPTTPNTGGTTLVGTGVGNHQGLQRQLQRLEKSGMTVSLTTNQSAYNPGQVVKMTLTLTNTSNHNETIQFGPSVDYFYITHNSKVIWRSTEGFVPQFIARKVLAPGQSITLSAQWTVPSNMTGSFVVHNHLAPSGPVAQFAVTDNPISTT